MLCKSRVALEVCKSLLFSVFKVFFNEFCLVCDSGCGARHVWAAASCSGGGLEAGQRIPRGFKQVRWFSTVPCYTSVHPLSPPPPSSSSSLPPPLPPSSSSSVFLPSHSGGLTHVQHAMLMVNSKLLAICGYVNIMYESNII